MVSIKHYNRLQDKYYIDKNFTVLIVVNSDVKTIILYWENLYAHSPITSDVGFIILDVLGGVTMEPEEHKGFMISDAPGWMFKATKIIPSAHFKHTLNACTVESLKISINYELGKIKRRTQYKPVKN